MARNERRPSSGGQKGPSDRSRKSMGKGSKSHRPGPGPRPQGRPERRRGLREGLEDRGVGAGAVATDRGSEREAREDRLEGRHAVEEALKAGQAIDKVWVMQSREGDVSPHLAILARQAKDAGAVIVEAPKASLDRLSSTGVHQGIIAQIPAVEYVEPEAMLELAREREEEPFLILLDQIQDSHNLGAVIRVADAVGAHGVIIPKHRALGIDAVAMRASAGSANHVLCARVTNLSQTMRDLKDAGVWMAGTDAEGDNALTTDSLRGPIALIIGNEGEGMSQLVRETCDFVVSLPMLGQVTSLNASVACGILAYRVRQLRDTQRPSS